MGCKLFFWVPLTGGVFVNLKNRIGYLKNRGRGVLLVGLNILRRYKKYGTPDRVCDTECKGSPPPFVVVLGGWVSHQNEN